MSDAGMPPPPPPPGLTPPPGAVGYRPTTWNMARLHRVGGLAKALVVLLAVMVLAQLATLPAIARAVGASEDFTDNLIDEDEFVRRLAPVLGLGFVAFACQIAIVVITMIWLYRVAANHRQLGRRTTFGPGWAIGGWFLPPIFYVIPTLMVREQWKAAEPTSPAGDDGWRRVGEPVLVLVWFVVYSVIPVILAVTNGLRYGAMWGGDAEDSAENFIDSRASLYGSSVVAVVGAVVWALVVRGLTARHRRLTGEAG